MLEVCERQIASTGQALQDSSKTDCDRMASCECPIVPQKRQAPCLACPRKCICPPNTECILGILHIQSWPRLEQELETCSYECPGSVGLQQQLPLRQVPQACHCRIGELGQKLSLSLRRSAPPLCSTIIQASQCFQDLHEHC